MVWVNENVNIIPVANAVTSQNMLSSAVDFMTFDTTIVRVVIPMLSFSGDALTVNGLREVRYALQVAPTSMDANDFEPPFGDSIGPPWMYVGGRSVRLVAASTFTFDLVGENFIDIKAARRFRENDSTLHLIVQTVMAGTNDVLSMNGMIRTLLRIP